MRPTPIFQNPPTTLRDLRDKFPKDYDSHSKNIFEQRMKHHTDIIKARLMELSELTDKLLEKHKRPSCYLKFTEPQEKIISDHQRLGQALLSRLLLRR